MDILRRVKQTIQDNELLFPGDSVLIALSGGPDSVALMHLLSRLRKSMKLSLTAVYINHQIRKKAANKEETFCQGLCDSLKIELDLVSEDIPAMAKKRGKGVEETARDYRYEVFELLASEDGHDRIALGHHADDRAETVLFRIIRGTGPFGLVGIPVKRGNIIRPLFDLTKEEILAYLKSRKIKFCLDKSNTGLEYDRNYIRNRLLREIRKNLNPRVDRALLNLSKLVADDDAYLEKLVDRAAKKAISMTPGGKIELDLHLLTRYDAPVRRRLLRRCMKTISPDSLAPDKEVIERLDKLAVTSGKPVSLPGRSQAETTSEKLVIYRKRKLDFSETIVPGQTCRLTKLNMDFRCRESSYAASGSLKRKKRSKKITLDLNKLQPPFVVRSVKAGDRFAPLGLGGSKKVGDYLTDRKIPAVYRDEIPVVCDRRGIVWLVGHEIDDRAKIDSTTRKVVTFEVIVRKISSAPAI